MRLTFDVGYEDYSDVANWFPRLEKMERSCMILRLVDPEQAGQKQVLDGMETLDELMRYYTFAHDYYKLENAMRLQQKYLAAAKKWGETTEVLYIAMEFARINSILYRSDGQNQQSALSYDEACEAAEKCFTAMRYFPGLTGDQKLYVGWACAEVFYEAACCYMDVMNMAAVQQASQMGLIVLDEISQYWKNAVGIQDKASGMYAAYGGMYYQLGKTDQGAQCFLRAIDQMEELGKVGDFWKARAIWQKSVYSLQAYSAKQDTVIMHQCEQEANQIAGTLETERDNRIVQAAQGELLVLQGLIAQMHGQFPQAILHTEKGIVCLEEASDFLKKEVMNGRDSYKAVLRSILGGICSSYVGALERVGVLKYFAKDFAAAKQSLKKALASLDGEYSPTEYASAVLRAESNEYLMLIAQEENNADQILFYGALAAEQAGEIVRKGGNAAVLNIEIAACAMLAEVYLALKNKPKAAEYSRRGLEACAAAEHESKYIPQTDLKKILEKCLRKANRTFF